MFLGLSDSLLSPQDKTVVQEIVAQDGTQEAIILPESTPMDHDQEASAAAAQQNESTQQQATGVKPKKSTKGELFYKYFQTQIDAQILIKFEDYVKPLMSLLHNHPIVFHILLSLIDKHIKTRAVTPVSQRRAFLRYSQLLSMLHLLGGRTLPFPIALVFSWRTCSAWECGPTPTRLGSRRNARSISCKSFLCSTPTSSSQAAPPAPAAVCTLAPANVLW
jgi:hypothetical protein